MSDVLAQISWNPDGLIAAIAQDWRTGDVLMMAWMNREALARTIETGQAVYWSRSRRRLWHKGESSGHVQLIKSMHLDCDADALLLKIEQTGGIACHTGRRSCFFRELRQGHWETVEPVLIDPHAIYGPDR